MYNKNQFKKTNNKNILHKVKKQWIIVSLALFMMLGSGVVATHASATTTINNAKSQRMAKFSSNKLHHYNNQNLTISSKASQLHSQLINNISTNTIRLGSRRKKRNYHRVHILKNRFRRSNNNRVLKRSGYINTKKYGGNLLFNHYAPNDKRAIVPKRLNLKYLTWAKGHFGQINPIIYVQKYGGWLQLTKNSSYKYKNKLKHIYRNAHKSHKHDKRIHSKINNKLKHVHKNTKKYRKHIKHTRKTNNNLKHQKKLINKLRNTSNEKPDMTQHNKPNDTYSYLNDIQGPQYTYSNSSDTNGESESELAHSDANTFMTHGIRDRYDRSDDPSDEKIHVGFINYCVKHLNNPEYFNTLAKTEAMNWGDTGYNLFKNVVIPSLNEYAHGDKTFRIGWLDGNYGVDEDSYFDTHYNGNDEYKAGWIAGARAKDPDDSPERLLQLSNYMNLPALEAQNIDGQISEQEPAPKFPSSTYLTLSQWTDL